MPLIKGFSPKSFSGNVAAKMNAGKPQNQSLAIAYAVKRAAMKKAQHKAMGGMIEESQPEELQEGEGLFEIEPDELEQETPEMKRHKRLAALFSR